MEFQPFPKIPRLRRGCTITEKIDGTNAQVVIEEGVPHDEDPTIVATSFTTHPIAVYTVRAGSRSRWLTPGKATDNFGFAGWVKDHADELVRVLGPGRHFGEWWGAGIQRGYDMRTKQFSLFNTSRWRDESGYLGAELAESPLRHMGELDVVPVLYTGGFNEKAIDDRLVDLRRHGSHAMPFYDKPEGIVVRLNASGHTYKVLLDGDELPKGAVA